MDYAPAPDSADEEVTIPQIFYLLHGWFAFAAFGFLFPVAIMIARFGQHVGASGTWFHLHRFLNILGVIFATVSIAIGFNKFGMPLDIAHMKLGVALGIVIWLQPLIALVRPHKGQSARVTWYMVHWLFGIAAVILGIVNIELGLNAFKEFASPENYPGNRIHTSFAIYVAVLGFFYLFLQQLPYLARQRNPNEHRLLLPTHCDDQLSPGHESSMKKVQTKTAVLLSPRSLLMNRTAELI